MKSANIQVGDLIIVEKVSGSRRCVCVCVNVTSLPPRRGASHVVCGAGGLLEWMLFARLSNSAAWGEKISLPGDTCAKHVFKVRVCWLARNLAYRLSF